MDIKDGIGFMAKKTVDAVVSRDSDRAAELFRAHIQLTADILFDNQ